MRWRRMIVAVVCGSVLSSVGVMFWSLPAAGVVQEITAAVIPASVPATGWQIVTDLIVWGVVTLPGVALVEPVFRRFHVNGANQRHIRIRQPQKRKALRPALRQRSL